LVDILEAYTQCPVCGSTERSALPPEEEFHNRYTNAMAAYAGIPADQLLAKIDVYRCTDCTTEYCDPWVTREFAAEIYGVVMGQHRFGWWMFDQWANNLNEFSTSRMKQEVIWKYLLKHAGKINSYAEVNCPFAGFMTYFDRMNGPLAEDERARISDFIIAMREAYHESQAFGGWPKKLDRPAPPALAPGNRYVIREPSSYFWGNNCVHQNTSCHAMAMMLFGVQTTSFAEIADQAIELDVIGLFQALDHFVDPMTVLEKALDAARVVIVVGHGLNNSIHKQHQFQFGGEFLEYLGKAGYSVLDMPEAEIAETVGDKYNSRAFLISKKVKFKGKRGSN
jgi:hypothetical protein